MLTRLWHKNATLKAKGDPRGAERVDELWRAMELLKSIQAERESILKALRHLQFIAKGGWTTPEENPEYVKWTNLIKTFKP